LAAEACARVGDADAASLLADHLAPYHQCVAHTTAVTAGAVSHYLGLLATVRRSFEEADAQFAAAEATHERLGAPTLLARTRLEWADMLMSRSAAGDADRATTLLEEALRLLGRWRGWH
jgi:hypothetical protein